MPSASSLHPDLSDAMHETLVMLRAQVNDKDLSPAERRLAGNSIIRLVAVAGRFQGGTGLGGTGLGGTGLQTGVRNSSRRRRTHSDNDDRSYHRDASPSSASSSAPSSPLTNPDFAYEPGPRISSPSGLDTLNDERAPVAATTDPTSSSLNPPSPIAGGTLGGGGLPPAPHTHVSQLLAHAGQAEPAGALASAQPNAAPDLTTDHSQPFTPATATDPFTPAQIAALFPPDLYDPSVTPQEHRRLELIEYRHLHNVISTYQGHRDERASLVDIFQRIAARYSLDPAPPHTPPRRYNPPRASPEPPSYREAG